ncbi:ATP-binding protein [Paraurantiacibacter namhicola]|uniref:histidine kinase n=1 Tax=Paraurantiacibacter namhicola TaxID=645517 RepID=A0A1C7D671_9SPHN|nr:ATP-binding protein [Paraurantiacibacter namhicola]ANU06955.1 Osmolarity sensor protein EnvZ [Paraurantiacibacter namhicola]
MRRFLPKSLLGQVLLAVAAALLIAQAISAVLLLRAQEQRREAVAMNALAIQMAEDPDERMARRIARRGQERAGTGAGLRGERRAGPRGEGTPGGLLRPRLAEQGPIRSGDVRSPGREAELRELLERQGIPIAELVVVERDPMADRRVQRFLQRRGGAALRQRWLRGKILVGGIRRAGSDQWLIARAPIPAVEPRALGSIIAQTLILYLVLVGLLWALLRRLTRPLAALTRRTAEFAETRGIEGQIEPSGPSDTRQLIAAHNRMEARIAGLMDEKDVMLGAIGHDLKTPLAALRVRIESVTDDAQRGKMAASIADLDRTLDDILSLARVGRPTDAAERTDLSALAGAVVEEYEDRGKPVTLADGARVTATIRPTWLRRALRNLVSNAVRYAGSARVSVLQDGPVAVLRVEDDGPGIPDDQLADMLEPFRRGDASRNRGTGGSGLGLTLARAIAQQHGGQLLIQNRRAADGTPQGLLAELHIPLD